MIFQSLFKIFLIGFLLFSVIGKSIANNQWSIWEQFKQYYISNEGRVVDPISPEQKTTSEGQAYGLFFSLVSNDRILFKKLINWTENNLAAGNLKKHLPAWKWGQNSKKQWVVLDQNSASDADLWIAYDLIEAGRLWNNVHYDSLGKNLLQRVFKEEVIFIPGLGQVILPGKYGFKLDNSWRLNPSYLPPQLLARFSAININWKEVEHNSWRILMETSPKGFAPDWIIWSKELGWQSDKIYPNLGSYDAIRVYLWVGMLAHEAQQAAVLTKHFLPVITLIKKLGITPEKINVLNGNTQGIGPIGFYAALLPLLANNHSILTKQRQQIDRVGFTADNYYNSVLRLFGQGWDENRFRFNTQGELVLP